MSDKATVAVSGKEGGRVYAGDGLSVVPKPNSASDPDVAVNGKEGAILDGQLDV